MTILRSARASSAAVSSMHLFSLPGATPPTRSMHDRGPDAADAAVGRPLWRRPLLGVAALLATLAVYNVWIGTWGPWACRSDCDLQDRAREYALFREGCYPNAHLERPEPPAQPRHSVYPPYAFPLLAILFEPGGIVQGRLLLQLLSLASFLLMGVLAWRVLGPWGMPLAVVAGLAGPAAMASKYALWVGQFSIICTGLIVAQLLLIERGRPLAAGACWAVAMLKPQIALPFLLLFFLAGQGSGALLGVGLLAGLTLFACVWTDVPLTGIVAHWSGGMSLRFTEETSSLGPGAVAKVLGADPRVMQVVALLVLTAVGAAVALFIRRAGPRALLPVAGACAVAGMLFCYHRRYDDVMLYPALLAAIASAASSTRPAAVFVAGSMLTLLLLPYQLVDRMPAIKIVECVMWVTACLISLRSLATPREPPAGDLDRPLHAAS